MRIFLRLKTESKSRDGYKAGHDVAWLLKQCGWTEHKRTRNYCYLDPPPGQKGATTVAVRLPAPTDEEILAVAGEMHANSVPVDKMLHGWPMRYVPAHREPATYTDVDPFTGVRGNSQTYDSDVAAVCRVGFVSIWQVEVHWGRDGQPTLLKHSPRAIPAPPLGLFDVPPGGDNGPKPSSPEAPTYLEGAMQSTVVDVYERDTKARKACIDHYGTRCSICGMDFGERYGEIGKEFIHVHHLRPLSDIGECYEVDPIKDLRPVCPNCHAMLHRTTPPLKIEELRSRLKDCIF